MLWPHSLPMLYRLWPSPFTRAYLLNPVHVAADYGQVLGSIRRYQNYVLDADTADGLEAGQYLVVYERRITHHC
jgi:hypothetical protein